MSEMGLSRRDAIRSLGGMLAMGAAGLGTFAQRAIVSAIEPANDQPFVDAHIHIASSRLSRGTALPPPYDIVQQPGGSERLAKLVANQLAAARVGHALCMPSALVSDRDPLGIQPTLALAALIPGAKLHPVGIAHPERFDREHLEQVEAELKLKRVKALKAYLGYLHYSPLFLGYRPYYQLAAKYDIPIIFHTGDTNSPVAKVKFAHPLQVDEVAVDFPDTKFVLAHFGNPWIMDAAQVVYKNKNVWAELSAFLIGEAPAFAKMEKEGVIERAVTRIKEGIEYAEAPDRFLFGSDWPLAPINVYRDFVARLFPKENHEAIFGGNAKKLFGL